MERIFCTLWSIWSERNKVVHGQRATLVRNLASFASIYIQNYQSATHKYHVDASQTRSQPPPLIIPAPEPWKPPLTSTLKLNVDATVDEKSNIIGVGALVCDSNGCVTAALSMPAIGNFSSHEMEAKALFHNLNWALQQDLPISVIETGALMVGNSLKAPFNSISTFHDLIVDIRCLLSFFPNVIVSYVKRTVNMATNGLAKFALGVDEICFWLETIPPPIYSFIVNDYLF
uniref:RNase H type-1 domain-containing protein n=1 Tax=Cannabis sativa TaxID=3483 RepID=A0A803QDM2_CANSA